MKKKIYIFFLVFVVLINNVFAEREDPKVVEPISNKNFKYSAGAVYSNDYNNWIGVITVESINSPKYFYKVPIYSISLNEDLETDVQWVFINDIEFKDENTIIITNEDNNVFEMNIDTYEVTPVNVETQLFAFDIKNHKTRPVLEKIKDQIYLIFEKDNFLIIQNNKKYKYTGIQPRKKKLKKIEDVVFVAEKILFQIYGEEDIKNEQPYHISKYKNKWIVTGSLPKGCVGGVFEIVINADNSQIESVIHGE